MSALTFLLDTFFFFSILSLSVFTLGVRRARVVELVDTLDLGSSAIEHEGSTPFSRTYQLF